MSVIQREKKTRNILLKLNIHQSFVFAVSRSIQAINEAVDAGDPVQTLAALRSPGAGLYGVTSECAQTYQDDLAKAKNQKNTEGEDKTYKTSPHSSCFC